MDRQPQQAGGGGGAKRSVDALWRELQAATAPRGRLPGISFTQRVAPRPPAAKKPSFIAGLRGGTAGGSGSGSAGADGAGQPGHGTAPAGEPAEAVLVRRLALASLRTGLVPPPQNKPHCAPHCCCRPRCSATSTVWATGIAGCGSRR